MIDPRDPNLKWQVAQEEPGMVNHVWWSLIDTKASMVRGHLFGLSLAQDIADGLNAAEATDDPPKV